jgi:transposase
VTKAAFPEGVVSPTQYGERIKAAAIYLNVRQLIPEDRPAEALSDLFGAPLLCPASLTGWVRKKARDLQRIHAGIGARLAEAKVRHLDETGLRVAGKLHWLHTTSSKAFTFYRAEEKRGAIPSDLKGGVVVHDGFAPYGALGQIDHALWGLSGMSVLTRRALRSTFRLAGSITRQAIPKSGAVSFDLFAQEDSDATVQ